MKTEQELTDKCTPEIIKKMCELAEGFECAITSDDYNYIILPDGFRSSFDLILGNVLAFSTLIHRAVEGWNKKNENLREWIELDKQQTSLFRHGVYRFEFKNYQPTTLTRAGCAMLDCLLEVLK